MTDVNVLLCCWEKEVCTFFKQILCSLHTVSLCHRECAHEHSAETNRKLNMDFFFKKLGIQLQQTLLFFNEKSVEWCKSFSVELSVPVAPLYLKPLLTFETCREQKLHTSSTRTDCSYSGLTCLLILR